MWRKSNRQSRNQNTAFAFDSVAYDAVKTRLSEAKAEAD